MPVRSRLLVLTSGTFQSDTTYTLFSCPPDRTALVRDYHLLNTGAVINQGFLGVRRGLSSHWLYAALNLASLASLGGQGRYLVLAPGDDLIVRTHTTGGASSSISVVASGSLLDGVAS